MCLGADLVVGPICLITTRPRIEPGSPDPKSDALTTRPGRSPKYRFKNHLRKYRVHRALLCNNTEYIQGINQGL